MIISNLDYMACMMKPKTRILLMIFCLAHCSRAILWCILAVFGSM